MLKIGLNDEYPRVVGSQEYLIEYYAISCKNIIDKIMKLIEG
jgi:transketolase C-terminal domain/subunit